MMNALNQINSVPGVIGSLISDDDGTLLDACFPPLFDRSALEATVSLVSENFPGLREITGGVKMVDFRYQNGRVIAKLFGKYYLLLLCENSINPQLLGITLNVAARNLEKVLSPKQTTGFKKPKVTSLTSQSDGALSVAALLEKSAISHNLQGMQACLAKFLGPMAIIIFTECVERWLQHNQPTRSCLPRLAEIARNEIHDSAKADEYEQMVSRFL